MEWEKVSDSLYVLDMFEGNGFYIMYSEDKSKGFKETIIVQTLLDGKQNLFIIKGDHRHRLQAIYPKGFRACMDFYNKFPLVDKKDCPTRPDVVSLRTIEV